MASSTGAGRAESHQARDANPRAENISLFGVTKQILEMIAAGTCLTDILTNLCAAIDDLNPEARSMVMLMDPDGERMWPGAASRVPSDFMDAFRPLMIGPNMGSCGVAALRKERVIVS